MEITSKCFPLFLPLYAYFNLFKILLQKALKVLIFAYEKMNAAGSVGAGCASPLETVESMEKAFQQSMYQLDSELRAGAFLAGTF